MTRTHGHLTGLAILTAGALALTGCGSDPGYDDDGGTSDRGADVRSPTGDLAAAPPGAAGPAETAPTTTTATGEANDVRASVEVTASAETDPGAADAAAVEPAADPHAAFREAEALYAEGDRAAAIPLLRRSIAARDGFVHAHYLLGLSLFKTGALDEADVSLRRALDLEPAHVRARTNLARVLVERGRAEEAIDTLDVAFANGETGADLWNVRGLARLALGDLEGAAADFESAVAIAPENPYALNNLGLTEIRRGRFEAAVGPLQRAAAIDGAPAYVFNNLGAALERTGALTQASAAYDEAIGRGHAHASVSRARVVEQAAHLAAGAPAEEAAVPAEAVAAAEANAPETDASLASVPDEAPEPATP